MVGFKKAEKKKSKLRLGIAAPSGGGKTTTALRIATGIANKIGSRIAFIDTEKGSASLYADKFDFDVLELSKPYRVDDYISAIQLAEKSGYKVLIVDSMTHGWKQIVEDVEKLAQVKYKGNTYRAWAEGTPLYDKWVDAMLSFDGHIIMTSRSKTEYAMEQIGGRTTITKVGMGIQNRGDFEYECTMFMEGTHNHLFEFTKDRTGKYQDQIIEKPDEAFGEELVDWLNNGAEIIETIEDVVLDIEHTIHKKLKDGVPKENIKKCLTENGFNDKINNIKDINLAKKILLDIKNI